MGWGSGSTVPLRVTIAYNSARLDGLIHAVVEHPEGSEGRATDDATIGRSGYVMTWEWEHRNNRGQWTLTVGTWHAVVQRVAHARPMWQATIERTTAPHDRYESPTYTEAVDARTWCLRKIAELASGAP
jgi:hypothetical protein